MCVSSICGLTRRGSGQSQSSRQTTQLCFSCATRTAIGWCSPSQAKSENKRAAPKSGPFAVDTSFRLARVEFDDEVRFHLDRVRHVRQGGHAGIGSDHLVVVDFHIVRHIAFGELDGFENDGELLGTLTDFDLVADLDLVGRNVHALAVDRYVAMGHELTGGKHGGHELGAVDDGVEARLEQADQVFTSVALAARRFVIKTTETFFGDRAIIALQLLLGAQLQTVVRKLALATLTVLAGAISTSVQGGLRTAPDVFAKTAVNLVFGRMTLRHRVSLSKLEWIAPSFAPVSRGRQIPKNSGDPGCAYRP